MKDNFYSRTFFVDQNPQQVFDAVNNVQGWWSQDFRGASLKTGDEFEVRFADVHFSKHKLTELVPGSKITWLVTDSKLNFLENKTEWTGTTNVFEISKSGNKTQLVFTHVGLEPGIECFKDCSKGWDYYLEQSLLPFITTGKGKPNEASDQGTRRTVKPA